MPAEATDNRVAGARSSDARKPSGRQMFRIAYCLLEIAGLDAPATSADASLLIDRLEEQRAAVRATVAHEEIPF